MGLWGREAKSQAMFWKNWMVNDWPGVLLSSNLMIVCPVPVELAAERILGKFCTPSVSLTSLDLT